MIGIKNKFDVAADVAFAASTALLTVGLTSLIAANERQTIRAVVPITTGATGGVKTQLIVPAGGSYFIHSIKIFDLVANTFTGNVATASAAVADPLANAGNHLVEVEATVINGATAGNIDLQFAQDSAANTTTILKGGFMEVVKG